MGKTLIVSNDCPFPANHGGRLDIMQRIKSLIGVGEIVDLVVTHKEKIPQESKDYLLSICNKVIFVQRLSPLRSLAKSIIHVLPFQVASRYSLKEIKLPSAYNTLICESEHVNAILKNDTLIAEKKFLRIHNNEEVYFKGLYRDESNILKKFYYYYESILIKLNEKKIKNQYDLLLNISSEEYTKTKEKYNSVWLPPDMPIAHSFNADKFSKFKYRMIFVGNLFMPNNVGGIIWYLNNVHELLLRKNNKIELTIAGNAKNGISHELEKAISTFPDGAVKLVKSPNDEELLSLYNTHSVFINPMLNGAGVKLKNLDAMRNSFCVVSTTIGSEGTGVTNKVNTLIADTSEGFLTELVEAFSNDKAIILAQNAYEHIKNNFDTKMILKNIM